MSEITLTAEEVKTIFEKLQKGESTQEEELQLLKTLNLGVEAMRDLAKEFGNEIKVEELKNTNTEK